MQIDIRSAYRKFKSFVYYDGSNLHLRRMVAEFEAAGNADDRLDELHLHLTGGDPNSEYWQHILSQIQYRKFVKQYAQIETNSSLITNKEPERKHHVSRVNYFIDAPIELHICSALWLLHVGYRLENLMGIPPFGNKIDLDELDGVSQPSDGLKFYRPYFNQYKSWRDGAVQAARELVDRDKNALIIGLDVKDFYHSVRIDLNDINRKAVGENVPREVRAVCSVFGAIHHEYTRKILGETGVKQGLSILPIGLMSSGVLANYYLNDLDTEIVSAMRPDFYGRYVDDILIVTSCPDDQVIDDPDKIANQYLVETGIFEFTEARAYRLISLPEIEIQSEKLSVLHFVSTEPTALLDKFSADIKKNSSEYRWLPEDEAIDHDFDESAYNLKYKGSGNKLRDIKEFGEDKFGISKFLAKKIYLALQTGHDPDEKAVVKVARFFRGRRAVELHSLWEKVFVFLLVNEANMELIAVVRELLESIQNIEVGDAQDWTPADRRSYVDHCFYGLSMALSLKPSVLAEDGFGRKFERELCNDNAWSVQAFKEAISALRLSNMVRHFYVAQPLLNYAKKDDKGRHYDLVNYSHYFAGSRKPLEIDSRKLRFSPRFVNFHEVILFHVQNRVSTGNSKFFQTGFHFGTRVSKSRLDYLDAAFDDYFRLNYARHDGNIDRSKVSYRSRKQELYELEPANPKNNWIRRLTLTDETPATKLRVAVANVKIPDEVITHPYLRKPIIDSARREVLHGLLNDAERERVDMLVMPEISVPIAWFKWLADYSLKKRRCLVFGLEHWVVVNRAFNFLVCMMPVVANGFPQLVIDVRLKNYYSPGERHLLESYGYIIPETTDAYYDLINWNGIHFTSFNCFELSNINDRAQFKSKVDLLTVSEVNRDIAYFSNLVESCSRDLHCFVVQVNDSRFGDSRVCKPASSATMDMIKVKGGENATILVATLDVNELREFQLKEHSGQKDFGVFKPTPPHFDRGAVRSRMKY